MTYLLNHYSPGCAISYVLWLRNQCTSRDCVFISGKRRVGSSGNAGTPSQAYGPSYRMIEKSCGANLGLSVSLGFPTGLKPRGGFCCLHWCFFSETLTGNNSISSGLQCGLHLSSSCLSFVKNGVRSVWTAGTRGKRSVFHSVCIPAHLRGHIPERDERSS